VSTTQIIFGILTVAMSGVVTALVMFRLNARREDRQFRRQRLEHLFRAYVGYCRQLGIHWMPYESVMTGSVDYNQAQRQVIAGGKDERRNFDEIEMLIAIYWPELRPHLEEVIKVRDQGSRVIANHKRRYEAGQTQDEESFLAMKSAIEKLGDIEVAFAKAVRDEASKLA
jgi:hypothetical protein